MKWQGHKFTCMYTYICMHLKNRVTLYCLKVPNIEIRFDMNLRRQYNTIPM